MIKYDSFELNPELDDNPDPIGIFPVTSKSKPIDFFSPKSSSTALNRFHQPDIKNMTVQFSMILNPDP